MNRKRCDRCIQDNNSCSQMIRRDETKRIRTSLVQQDTIFSVSKEQRRELFRRYCQKHEHPQMGKWYRRYVAAAADYNKAVKQCSQYYQRGRRGWTKTEGGTVRNREKEAIRRLDQARAPIWKHLVPFATVRLTEFGTSKPNRTCTHTKRTHTLIGPGH